MHLCRTLKTGRWKLIFTYAFLGHRWSSASEKLSTVKCKKKKSKMRWLLPLCTQIRGDFEGTGSGNTRETNLLDANPKIQRDHFWQYFPDAFSDLPSKCCCGAAARGSREETPTPWLYLKPPWMPVWSGRWCHSCPNKFGWDWQNTSKLPKQQLN